MAKDKSRKPARLARWRVWVQAAFLLVWLCPLVAIRDYCGPVFHCYSCPWASFACPIGVLANFSALHTIPFATLGTLTTMGAVFGAFICGWACPFGFLQDLIARVPTPKCTLPLWMGHLRYGVLLAFVLVIPYLWGEASPLFICRLCPAGAIEGALPNTVQQLIAREKQDGAGEQNKDSANQEGADKTVAEKPSIWPSTTKLVILGLILIAMFFTWRPWCTLFCPLGAIYSLFNHVSFMFLRFHRDRCVGCDDCRSLCLDGGQAERRVDGLYCVRCAECTRCRAVTIETVLSRSEKAQAD